ncbi:MAG: hypothetical protein HOK30_02995 [Rhodospirillaceae bacterium]|nr:hypothetical protein [Rhodospirillaceae bacterium]MBT6426604.1 hypothetical protein [Rhodospirillaceae bacterium]
MTEISYQDLAWPVRDDITAAHRRTWERLAQPGTWLSGAERVAIAREARGALDCQLCRDRKDALSPNAVNGSHDHTGQLPELEVEQIHRIRTDPGRLSRAWHEGLREAGMVEERYVETVGVIANIVAMDTFTKGLGLDPWPLPAPQPGEPTRLRPVAAKQQMAWVSTLAPQDAIGTADEDLYAGRPTAAHIYQAMSLVPASVKGFFDLVVNQYLPPQAMTDFDNEYRAINHAQIELVAGRVSAINQCVY